MLIITSLLFLLSHRADSITTLFVAVTAILIIEPYAVFDVGLWLSAFATLGILLFLEFYEGVKSKGKPTVKARLFNALVIPVVISLFAFGATFLLSAATFDRFSLLAPITTPIYSIPIEIYMYLGILFLICGKL
jgi:competence protein ComEC